VAHELTQNGNWQYEMFYTGKKPWHGLGQALDKPATAEEAIKAANLGWTVSKRELITVDGIPITGHKAVIRDDNKFPLSVMSDDYEIVQNTEAFAFFDSVVGTGGAYYETAGSIQGGKKVFLVAKLPEVIKATKNDITEQYLTLVNSYDGKMSLRMMFSPIRVVCANTLRAALRNMNESISIRHIGDVDAKIREAQNALGLAHRYFAEYQEIVDRLVKAVATKEMVESFLNSCFEITPPEEVSTRTKNAMNVVKHLFNSPNNTDYGISGTAWALYNAATEYADHAATSVKGDADRRMNSIMFGSSANFKQRAMDSILELVK
jgi:phage/plasmid-like protein (TIGR03299 family)